MKLRSKKVKINLKILFDYLERARQEFNNQRYEESLSFINTIFETMNDRGLNLTSTEMLKGYLLSNIDTEERKLEANDLWKDHTL